MDLRYLENFILVVELGSIAEAARRLGLTPATLAQRLRTLEASVGARLLVRAGRTVKPAAAGVRIIDRARRIQREVRDLKAAASDTDLPAGPLRLGAIPTALSGFVPGMLKAWAHQYPHVSVLIELGSSNTLYGKVLDDSIDAAILAHPGFDLPKTCAWQSLRREPLVLLTPADMRVDGVLSTLEREPYIRHNRDVIAGKLADDYLHRHGIRPSVRFELEGIESIARLVSEGLGVSVLPDWMMPGTADATLRRWPLPRPAPSRDVGIVWTRASARSPLVEVFVALARTLAGAVRSRA